MQWQFLLHPALALPISSFAEAGQPWLGKCGAPLERFPISVSIPFGVAKKIEVFI